MIRKIGYALYILSFIIPSSLHVDFGWFHGAGIFLLCYTFGAATLAQGNLIGIYLWILATSNVFTLPIRPWRRQWRILQALLAISVFPMMFVHNLFSGFTTFEPYYLWVLGIILVQYSYLSEARRASSSTA